MEQKVLEGLLALVEAAGEEIIRRYRTSDFEITIKSDDSPLTSADMAAHDLLVGGLAAISGLPVLSEEDPVPFEKRKTWGRFWLVDPLDGTRDFIARTDDFTVNVALIEAGKPVCGAVGVPARGLVYFAVAGEGAFLLHDGKRERIFSEKKRQKLICAVSRFHCDSATKDFCSRNGIREMQPYGSALKLCRVADGSVDIYPRFGPTKEWDIAAGQCVVCEAGGNLIGVQSGSELRYNKEDLVNEGFIAMGRDLDLR